MDVFFVILKFFITIFLVGMIFVIPFLVASLVVDKEFVPRVSCFNYIRGSFSHMCEWKIQKILNVTIVTLGSRPKQRLAKVQVRVKPTSHMSCSWKRRRVWGNEPPHSQANSHFGSWSLDRLLNFQRVIVGGQDSLDWRVPYIIGKLLEHTCLKWAHMTHLGT